MATRDASTPEEEDGADEEGGRGAKAAFSVALDLASSGIDL